jgi:LacI family transcriptional regulator
MATPPRAVALLIDSSTSWGSSIIQGAACYAERHGPWFFYLGQHGKHERQSLPRSQPLDGCIARVTSKKLAHEIRAAGLPAVNVSWYRHGEGQIPVCTAGGRLAGEMAARYFRDRGHSHFGYLGPPPSPGYRNQCREAYVQALAPAGHAVPVFSAPRAPVWGGPDELRNNLSDWLIRLTKPAAVLTFDSAYGREATEACRRAGLRVPEEVSVLAGEHDELFSSISTPRLSAIDLNPRQIGYEAAALLARLMAGEKPPARPLLIPPAGILSCLSTDTLAVPDCLVRNALAYIRAHATEPLQVTDVVEHVATSRRLLEHRFRSLLHRSPAAEIRRVRLERARQLLEDRDLSIHAVAARAGFQHPEVFTRVFRRECGISPSDYRLQFPGPGKV